MKIKIINNISYQTFPITEDMVDLDITQEELKQVGLTKQFDLETYELKPYINPQIEIDELKSWFENEYSYKEQKYRRLISLNKPDDDGVDCNEKLAVLYQKAEINRTRIQELEKMV